MNKKSDNSLIISYLTLRRSIGWLGILLPIFLMVYCFTVCNCSMVQDSISQYYHTFSGDMFVGVICAIAVFLFAYNGYDIKDSVACKLAALFAIGVVVFPTLPESVSNCYNPSNLLFPFSQTLHLIFAALFFLTLASISIFLFTMTDEKNINPRKRARNWIYYICGFIMVACLLLIAVYWLLIQKKFPEVENWRPVFWLETIALIAFGVSWLTKGEVIYKDIEVA